MADNKFSSPPAAYPLPPPGYPMQAPPPQYAESSVPVKTQHRGEKGSSVPVKTQHRGKKGFIEGCVAALCCCWLCEACCC